MLKINSKYIPLWTEKYRYAIISGGRGSSKSFSGQLFARDLMYQSGHKVISTRYTMTSAQKSVIPEFTHKLGLSQSPYDSQKTMEHDFRLANNTYTNIRSGSELIFTGIKTSSGNQTANLKSIEGLTTWLMEEAEELVDDGTDTEACTFDKIDDSIRLKGVDLRTILTWNPTDEESFIYKRFFKERGVDIKFNGIKDDVLYIYTTYHDNIDNLHDTFVDKANRVRESNYARYQHIYLGIPISENANALWKKRTMIDPFRVASAPPELKRIVVSVDPSVTSTGKQDECGIVVCGEDHKGNYYVLDDLSDMYSPREWGLAVVGAYKKWNADNIIAEVNQGGDLVEMNIRNTDRNIPVKKVRATRGKILRAEPVSALYEEGRVHHVGHYVKLEDEMCSYTGDDKEQSPNRLDALVYGIAELSDKQPLMYVGGV